MTGVNLKNALVALTLGFGLISCGNSEPEDVNVVDTTSHEEVLTEDMFESPDHRFRLPVFLRSQDWLIIPTSPIQPPIRQNTQRS